ncbi:Hypothetical protein OINT_1000900 [Brucella intermedia LMG 3301]|uniref:Uncharacterized protein n=1 Tax=Brucella intermedia LMG 3301 TaxID=641118 RepID=C4WFZ0_9HYPH|nr:Hypothetical protein OINT_1000900 [Brucella intermedia LMG 3301]
MMENSVRVCGESWNGNMPDGNGFAKQCLQIAFAPAIMDARLSWMHCRP